MKLAVVTINCNDVLSVNARRSYQAAAERWKAGYVELTEKDKPADMHPILWKLKIFDCVPADRLFWVDGSDTIIRADAPSPFDLCPPSHLGAVKDAQLRKPNYGDILAQQTSEWAAFNEVLNEPIPFYEDYINSGIMVLTRSIHQKAFDCAYKDRLRVGDRVAWQDQTAINFSAIRDNLPIQLMDETWNYMHPEQVGHWDYMEHYIYHFAGSPMRKTIIPDLDWKRRKPRIARRVKVTTSERTSLRAVVRRMSFLGWPFRYLYWWLSLPQRINRAQDRMMDIERRIGDVDMRLAELSRKASEGKAAE